MNNTNKVSTAVSVDVHDIFRQLARHLVGGVPIVGGVLSVATGYLFDWAGGTPDPWVTFENRINRLITNRLNESESRNVRNSLAGLDINLDRFLRDFEESVNTENHARNLPEFYDRIGSISDDAERLLPHILKPTSHHATAPYIEHFFVLSVAINVIGESLQQGTRNFSRRRLDLYAEIEKNIMTSLIRAGEERETEVEFKNFNTSSNKRIGQAVYDYSQNRKLGGTLFGWPDSVQDAKLKMMKSCARLVSVIDLYGSLIKNVHTVIRADQTVGFDAEKISGIYESVVSDNYDGFLALWNASPLRNMINSEVMDDSIKNLAKTPRERFSALPAAIPASVVSKLNTDA